VAKEATDRAFMRGGRPMFLMDASGRYVDVNAAGCLLLRASREHILTLTTDDLTPPDRLPQLADFWTALRRDGLITGEYVVLAPDGARVDVEYIVVANIEPDRHLGVLTVADRDTLRGVSDFRLPRLTRPTTSLTRRECEILSYVSIGDTGSVIAARLFLEPTTIETHVANALRKLGAKNRVHGVVIALRAGMLDPPGDLRRDQPSPPPPPPPPSPARPASRP
jgi:DNA-binding CsgD family transcriptional regulator